MGMPAPAVEILITGDRKSRINDKTLKVNDD
jgi:hypothetical protein